LLNALGRDGIKDLSLSGSAIHIQGDVSMLEDLELALRTTGETSWLFRRVEDFEMRNEGCGWFEDEGTKRDGESVTAIVLKLDVGALLTVDGIRPRSF
jgi:hypothetical protein